MGSRRRDFEEAGFLLLRAFLENSTLQDLRLALEQSIEAVRAHDEDAGFAAFEEGHTKKVPRIRRIAHLDSLDPRFWAFAERSPVVDLVAEVLAPNLIFRDIKVNFKWEGGGSEVTWHQDYASYPYSNRDTCQVLVFLEDIEESDGPLVVIPRSHKAPLLNHFDQNGRWSGTVNTEDLGPYLSQDHMHLTGPAGSVIVLHGHTLHRSAATNNSGRRPLLILGYHAADAAPLTQGLYGGPNYGRLVHGVKPSTFRCEAMSIRLPPQDYRFSATSTDV